MRVPLFSGAETAQPIVMVRLITKRKPEVNASVCISADEKIISGRDSVACTVKAGEGGRQVRSDGGSLGLGCGKAVYKRGARLFSIHEAGGR